MKNFKKKIVALGASMAVLASSVVSVSASAKWKAVDWKVWYVPYKGEVLATTTSVKVDNLYWNAAQVSKLKAMDSSTGKKHVIEFEFRPRGYKKVDVWSSCGELMSNLPDAYPEYQWYDAEDVAIGCGNPAGILAEGRYYGVLPLTKNPNFNANPAVYSFEVEYGKENLLSGLLHDYTPLCDAYLHNAANSAFMTVTYTWNHVPDLTIDVE